jgi:Domain of unknown function (DUF4132)
VADVNDWTDAAATSQVFGRLTAILTRGYQTSPDPESGAMDLAALKGGVEALGEDGAADLLSWIGNGIDTVVRIYSPETRESYRAHTDTVLAVMNRQRPRISKRFGNNTQSAIRAFGAFPLAEGETVADRYRQLQWSAKQASKFGAERGANHLICVRAAMEHLAQVGGYPDAVRMEFALDSDLAAQAADTAAGWQVGEYRLSLAVEGTEAAIVVERGGKRLKAVPKAVRSDPAYGEAREVQERLRGQARRLRSGLLEPLVTDGTPIAVADLAALLRLPAGREMIPALLWRTADGSVTGLLETDADGDEDPVLSLRGLDGVATPVTGRLHAVHPWDLFTAGTLAAWQQAVFTRRIVQPVRQVFRELYVLTPAEEEAGTRSTRFAGHRIDGARASRLLATRSWRLAPGDFDGAATRRFGELEARLAFDEMGHFLGEGAAVTGEIRFRRGESETVPLAQVPPLVLSEAMRDVDLVVSVAALVSTDRPYSTATVASRGELLAALAADLGLESIAVDGAFARVRGSLAQYRVHLGSGSIHIEPGGYLCIVPESAAAVSSRQLFLPFADEDVMTSVILSKVLLLVADDRITDPTIREQIDRALA